MNLGFDNNKSRIGLDLLETVDVMLLSGILKTPTSTPKEMLFLELGVEPFRETMLGFLFYILQENQNSMVSRFFEAQRQNPTPKDWVKTILNDIR